MLESLLEPMFEITDVILPIRISALRHYPKYMDKSKFILTLMLVARGNASGSGLLEGQGRGPENWSAIVK